MKKWAILALVVMGSALLMIQYFTNKTAKGRTLTTVTGQGEPVGVPLPPAATGYVAPRITPATDSGVEGDTNQLVLPNVPTDYKGACSGASLKEMGATHAKYWGYLAKNTPFSHKDTQKMYSFMADYIGCVAIARDNGGLCNSLPIEPPKDGVKNRYDLRDKCRKKVNPVLFIAYMAGKSKSGDSCRAALTGWKTKTLAKISVTDLCEAAAKGPEAANAYLLKTVPKNKKKMQKGPKRAGQSERTEMPERVREPFPTSESSCGKDRECVNGIRMYNAVKSGDVSKCPRPPAPGGGLKDQNAIKDASGKGTKSQARGGDSGKPGARDSFCEAAINNSALPCEGIVREMSRFYCAAVKRTQKANGGYIGMSKEEIEADIVQKKLEKGEEESRKKEMEKIQVEVNKRIRKMLGKE